MFTISVLVEVAPSINMEKSEATLCSPAESVIQEAAVTVPLNMVIVVHTNRSASLVGKAIRLTGRDGVSESAEATYSPPPVPHRKDPRDALRRLGAVDGPAMIIRRDDCKTGPASDDLVWLNVPANRPHEAIRYPVRFFNDRVTRAAKRIAGRM